MSLVELKGVSRIYTSGDHELKALDDINLSLDKSKFIVILGQSGAGKSTLLNLLGGLDSPTSGQIIVDGKDISTLTSDELAAYRAVTVGFVFQFYNLIPTLTVKENVELVNEIAPNALPAEKMIEEVGLIDHLNNFPSELSGGESPIRSPPNSHIRSIYDQIALHLSMTVADFFNLRPGAYRFSAGCPSAFFPFPLLLLLLRHPKRYS